METPVREQGSSNETNSRPVNASAQERGQRENPRSKQTPGPKKEREVGYECDFVELPPKVLQTDCSICLQILREPHMINCCGHNFCRLCIERIQKDGKACPLCNEVSFTLMHNKGLQRTLDEFHVRCTHQKASCQWTGELAKLDQHLNVKPEPEKQLEGCSLVQVECFHCREFLMRCLIKEHQEDKCRKRPFSCDYCRDYSSTYEDVESNHWPVCPRYILMCPNKCDSPYFVERQNLDYHLTKECPLTVVNCEFHYAGCEVRLPRKDIASHIAKETHHHISLLSKKFLEMGEKNALANKDLRCEINKVRQENRELESRLELLVEENQALKRRLEEQAQIRKEFTQETQVLKNQLGQGAVQALRDQLSCQMEEDLTKTTQALREEFKKALNQSVLELREQQEQQTAATQTKLEQELGRLKREDEELKRQISRKTATLTDQLEKEAQTLKDQLLYQAQSMGMLNEKHEQISKQNTVLREQIAAQPDGFRSEFMYATQMLEQDLSRRIQALESEVRTALALRMDFGRHQDELHQLILRLQEQQTQRQKLTDDKLKRVEQEQEVLKRKNEALKCEMEQKRHETEGCFDAPCQHTANPFEVVMTDFAKHKREGELWYSIPFYTHRYGYRLCLCVEARSEYVSVFVYLMRGQYDNVLKWPFCGTITIQLWNLLEHHEMTFNVTDQTPRVIAGRVTEEERAKEGLGFDEFITYAELDEYLLNDSLHFRFKFCVTGVRIQ